jgi:hypothetical protein
MTAFVPQPCWLWLQDQANAVKIARLMIDPSARPRKAVWHDPGYHALSIQHLASQSSGRASQ